MSWCSGATRPSCRTGSRTACGWRPACWGHQHRAPPLGPPPQQRPGTTPRRCEHCCGARAPGHVGRTSDASTRRSACGGSGERTPAHARRAPGLDCFAPSASRGHFFLLQLLQGLSPWMSSSGILGGIVAANVLGLLIVGAFIHRSNNNSHYASAIVSNNQQPAVGNFASDQQYNNQIPHVASQTINDKPAMQASHNDKTAMQASPKAVVLQTRGAINDQTAMQASPNAVVLQTRGATNDQTAMQASPQTRTQIRPVSILKQTTPAANTAAPRQQQTYVTDQNSKNRAVWVVNMVFTHIIFEFNTEISPEAQTTLENIQSDWTSDSDKLLSNVMLASIEADESDRQLDRQNDEIYLYIYAFITDSTIPPQPLVDKFSAYVFNTTGRDIFMKHLTDYV